MSDIVVSLQQAVPIQVLILGADITVMNPEGSSVDVQVSAPVEVANILQQDELSIQVNQGVPGPGVPSGGTAGQFLSKLSLANYDAAWDNLQIADVTGLPAELLNQHLQTEQFETDLSAPAWAEGKVFYDPVDHTLAYYNDQQGVTVNLGQEMLVKVVNKSGVQLNDGQVVYISGAQGNRPKVSLAQANTEIASVHTIGVVTADIPLNQEGYITTFGLVHGQNTQAFTVGDLIYLSPTTPGAWTNVEPVAPNHRVSIGFVLVSHPNQGVILVNVNNGFEIGELHDVKITAPLDGQLLRFNATLGVWQNYTPPAVLTGTSTTPPSAAGLPDGTQYLKYTP